MGNLRPLWKLGTDRLAQALLEHPNTPDLQTELSLAQIVIERQLQGFQKQGRLISVCLGKVVA